MNNLRRWIKELSTIIYDPKKHDYETPFDEPTGTIRISDLTEIRELLIDYLLLLDDKKEE